MKQFCIIVAVILSMLQSICFAGESQKGNVVFKDNSDRISYSLGYQIGGDLKKQKKEIDGAAFLQGMRDAQKGTSAVDPEVMRATLLAFKKNIVADGKSTDKAKNLQADLAFLKENRKKDGVVTLKSGLQYMTIKPGEGRTPSLKDTVTVHYTGRLVDGTEFYSTYRKGKPQTFPVSAAIPGWQEALLLMPVGSRWEIYIPHSLAYGEKGPLAERTVIFDLELLGIK